MMEAGVEAACGPRHGRNDKREAHRWGRTRGRVGFHGGKVEVERPRVRRVGGREVPIASWDRATAEDWLGRWAMNLMLINVSTRRFGRAVRLPEGDVPAGHGSGVSKSAASRRFVALSAEKLNAFMSADLSKLDLLVVQIDGLHVSEDLVLVAVIGIDDQGGKHPLAVVEGATENTATVRDRRAASDRDRSAAADRRLHAGRGRAAAAARQGLSTRARSSSGRAR